MTGAPRAVPPNTTGTRVVMAAPPPAAEPKPDPGTKRRLLRLAPGQIIPGTSWRITRWLGEGNMGVVYEARHVEIDRRAAIKIVAASLAEDPAAVQDFRAEASASAKIGSPNIVDVFDFAVLNDGRLMMAMEFVPGRSLHDLHVGEGRLGPDRLIGLFRQVCKGLQAAHEAGLVHRDIKPENIMVGEIAGRRDTVKLVDFGIATILGERSSRHAGTPYYMPPEGLLVGAIDGRYDVYSVGCVMYEMLSGAPPFVDKSLNRVLQMHMYEPLPQLVTDDPRVPRKLIEVIERCLAKQPEDRYASMAELEAALCEAQIEGKLRTTWDDLALPAIAPERQAKLLAKMPTRASKGVSGWWIPALIGLGVAVGAVIAWPMLAAEPTSASSTSAATEVEQLVARIHEAAALAYYVYPPVDDPQADTAYRVLSQLEAREGDEARDAAATLRAELASTLVRLGDEIWGKPGGEPFALDFYVQAIMFDPTIEPARTRATMSPGELLALRRKAGAGDFSEAELIAVEPLQAFAEPNLAAQQAKLEVIKTRRRDRRRASATAQLDTLIAIESDAPALLEVRSRDAPALLEPTDDAGDAAALVEPSEAANTETGSADALVTQAEAARKAARLQAAEKLYLRALRIEPQRVDALAGLAAVYFEQAKYAKAVTYYDLAVDRSASDAELRIALGDAYLKTLDYDRALAQYEKAKQLGSSKADNRIARIEQR
ncbi:protein kinase domain-containing protein [Nannocystaceae bacterium ST9]